LEHKGRHINNSLIRAITERSLNKLIAIPDEHKRILRDRIDAYESGKAELMDWEEAKKLLYEAIAKRKNPAI